MRDALDEGVAMGGRRESIRDVLRQRIRRALDDGALRGGDRLSSTREVATELAADPRVVAAAYRQLADEGLVELRARSGVFVAGPDGASPPTALPRAWLADVLTQGVTRGVPAPEVARQLQGAIGTREVRAVVFAATADQAEGMCRELRDDLGLACSPVLPEALRPGEPLPRAVRRAHLIVTTDALARRARPIAEHLGKRLVVVRVRTDLVAREFQNFLQQASYVVAADAGFLAIVRELLVGTPGERNVRLLVAGRDDLGVIPPAAATYVTQAARTRLGRTRLPGRLIRPPRIFSDDCVREIARAVVEENLGPP